MKRLFFALLNLKIKDIVNFLNAEIGGIPSETLDYSVTGVSVNSKEVQKGDLFVSLKGQKTDGHKYIKEAFYNGAVAFLCEEDFFLEDDFFRLKEVPVIKVSNTLKALQKIGFSIRKKFMGKIIGITGSCGKTTTKEFVSSVLKETFNVFKNKGNSNGQIGVPVTLFSLDSTYDLSVIEMGISDFNEMDILANIVNPDIAIITNIGHSHLEYLKSLENVFKEKFKITKNFSKDNVLFLNGDDHFLFSAKFFRVPFKILTFGVDSADLDFKAFNIKNTAEGIIFDVLWQEKVHKEFRINAVGEHILKDALAAICVGFYFNIAEDKIKSALLKLTACNGRQSIKELEILSKNSKKIKVTFIDDSYNANPESMKAAINVLASYKKSKRKISILADMLEQGKNSEVIHERLGELLAKNNIDILMTLGKYSKFTGEKFKEIKEDAIFFHFKSIDEIYTNLKNIVEDGDVILVKGSRGFHLEDLLKKFFM